MWEKKYEKERYVGGKVLKFKPKKVGVKKYRKIKQRKNKQYQVRKMTMKPRWSATWTASDSIPPPCLWSTRAVATRRRRPSSQGDLDVGGLERMGFKSILMEKKLVLMRKCVFESSSRPGCGWSTLPMYLTLALAMEENCMRFLSSCSWGWKAFDNKNRL